jgi:magnesium-transporting ATPase (P-type)
MLFFGQDIFGLQFAQSTPFYVDQAYLDANPGTALALNDPTNKCYMYTMVF